MPKGVYERKPENKTRVTAEQANTQGLSCKRGHVGSWRSDTRGSRHCGACRPFANKKYMYGLDEDTYNLMVEFQGGVCGICKQASKLYVDHDHKTGVVRGLLCNRCNLNLGLIESGFLEESQEYLRKYTTDSEPGYASGRVVKG